MNDDQIPLAKFVDIVAVAVMLSDDHLLNYLLERFVIDDAGAMLKTHRIVPRLADTVGREKG
jgi:hypothetical protein